MKNYCLFPEKCEPFGAGDDMVDNTGSRAGIFAESRESTMRIAACNKNQEKTSTMIEWIMRLYSPTRLWTLLASNFFNISSNFLHCLPSLDHSVWTGLAFPTTSTRHSTWLATWPRPRQLGSVVSLVTATTINVVRLTIPSDWTATDESRQSAK